MSSLLTTTGISLLVGIGVVSLPHPPLPGAGGGVPPPPATEWYDQVFAMRDGTGVGSQAVSYTPAATWAAATTGVSDNGTDSTTVSGAAITADGISFDNRLLTWSGNSAHLVNCVGEYRAGGSLGNWLISGDNAILDHFTIDNRITPVNGTPPLYFHATTANGTHLVKYGWFKDVPTDAIKAPNNGNLGIEWCFFDGYFLGAQGVHLDYLDMKAAGAASYVRNCIFRANFNPASPVNASFPSTGINAMIRCVPTDTHGYDGSGRTYEQLILIGSDDPFCSSILLSPSGNTATGIRLYDVLIDLREHNSMIEGQTRIDDWYVRTFDYAASVVAGKIVGISAPVPYPNLANHPAAVPSTMAAPVIVGLTGGFSYGPMQRPFNMRSLITGYTIEYSFDGIAWTSVAASLDGGTIATPAGPNLRARVYATNGVGNSTVSAVSNFVTVSAGVTQPLSINALPFDGFVFDAASTDSAVALITGKSDSLAAVQVRGEGAGGNTAWVATTADAAGNWTVFLSLDANAGEWYTPAARLGTNDATKVTSAAKFAGGDVHIFAGQSETEHIVATASVYNQNAYPALLAQNLTMITQANTGSRVIRRIDTTGIGVVNVAMVALANLFHRAKPGRKLLIIDNAVSGESRGALHNDANTGMNWSDLQSTIDLIRGAGGEIGHWTECWYNADASSIKTFGLSWAPFYMGQRWGGGSFTLGTANPDDGAGPVDHCLWDIEAAADVYGRGAFMRTRTKLHLLTPMPFHDTGSASENVNFTTDSGGALITNRIRSLDRPARDTLDAFGTDSRVQTFLGAVGPSCHVVDFAGGIHPLPGSQWGTPQYAMLHAPAVLRGAGYPIAEPTIDAANPVLGAAGAYVEIPVFLPNGGTLTTLRTLAGLSAPAVQPPHYQAVVGFEIRRAGDTDLQRRPVMKTTETSYPANYRGTVTISDSGTGSGAARKGIVRITPTNAFVTGDRFEYLRGQASAELIEMRDPNAQLFLDMLIEHIPGLYFPADTYPFYGVPVKPQPPLITV